MFYSRRPVWVDVTGLLCRAVCINVVRASTFSFSSCRMHTKAAESGPDVVPSVEHRRINVETLVFCAGGPQI